MENVLVPDCLPVVGKKNCPSVRPSTPSVWLVADRPVQCFVALLLVQAVATVTNRHTHTLNLDPIASQSADPHVLFLVVVNIFLLWPVVISPRFVGRGSRFLAVPSRFVVFVIRRVPTIMMHTSFRSCRINTRPTPSVPPPPTFKEYRLANKSVWMDLLNSTLPFASRHCPFGSSFVL